MTVALWIVVLAAAWALVRARVARREELAFVAAHPRDANGIIIGAEPIRMLGPRPGAVLLLHGYNDSPQSMASVAAALHARGWSVSAPLLPGHGRCLEAWAASRATEWENAARAELATLRSMHAQVAVGGLSMGGAIAFILAREQPDVRAVIAFAPYLHVSLPIGALRVVGRIAAIGGRYLPAGGSRSVHDPAAAAAMIAYRRSTPRLIMELERIAQLASAALPTVRQPVLIIQSREDNRISVASAEASFAVIGAKDKTLEWVTGSGHVITVDYGHEQVERMAADWLDARLD